MNWFKTRFETIVENLVGAALVDDNRRRVTLFKWLNIILMIVSLGMTIVNVATKEYILMWSNAKVNATLAEKTLRLLLHKWQKRLMRCCFKICTKSCIMKV